MNLKICTAIAIVACFSSQRSFSQTDSYISSGNKIRSGLKLFEGSDRNNAQFILEASGADTVKHTPADIAEYGLKDGRVYKTFDIETDDTTRYFFERLVRGRYSLYYLIDKNRHRSFYLAAGDSLPLIRIPEEKEAYIKLLSDCTLNCAQVRKNIEYVKLTKNSLKRFFTDYEQCSGNYLPRIRYELNVGMTLNKFKANDAQELISIPDYRYQTGLFASAYISLPVGVSNYAVVTGVAVDRYKRSGDFKDRGDTYDLVVDQWRLNLPVLLRYTFFNKKSLPFIDGGLLYARPIRGKTTLFKYEQTGDDIFLSFDRRPVIPDNQWGFTLGSGMIFNYNAQQSWMMRIAYNKLYATAHRERYLDVSEFMFSLGLLF